MKIVFFGSPAAALPSLRALLEAGHAVELVVTQPDKPAGRGRKLQPSAVKAFAVERGIPVIEPAKIRADEAALERIRAAGPDVNVVVAYGQIIPNAVHSFPRHRSLNVHFSLLPKYRGAAPVQWAVLNGDAESGVTIIELDDRMDEGDILASECVPVGPRETARELEDRLAVLGAELLLGTLARLDTFDGANPDLQFFANRCEKRRSVLTLSIPRPCQDRDWEARPRASDRGVEWVDSVVRVKQDDARATLAPKIKKEDGRIRWELNAVTVDRKVRALADRPGVYTFFKGRRIGILRGSNLETASAGQAPGRILAVGKEGLRVACGGGTAYLVEELQPEGKGPMAAHVFSLGTRIGPGDSLG